VRRQSGARAAARAPSRAAAAAAARARARTHLYTAPPVATETAGSAPIVTLELAAMIRLAERVRAAPFGKHSYWV